MTLIKCKNQGCFLRNMAYLVCQKQLFSKQQYIFNLESVRSICIIEIMFTFLDTSIVLFVNCLHIYVC